MVNQGFLHNYQNYTVYDARAAIVMSKSYYCTQADIKNIEKQEKKYYEL